jgi:arginyl-tRNA synthetase
MKQQIELTIAQAAQRLFGFEGQVELSRPDEQFGDYATNIALRLAKLAGTNPREVAETIAAELRVSLADQLNEVSIAGPGFINLRLSDKALLELSNQPVARTLSGKTVITEYSDPNPFKPLHAGHLYTTLVGDMIARLTEVAGARTVRVNYGGDVGLHVAKSMWSIIRHLGGELPEKLAGIAEDDRPAWLGERYVEGNNAYEDEKENEETGEKAKAEIVAINKRVYQLHESDDHTSPFAQIYWTCRQWSYDYFAVLYQQLQVAPFDRYLPESEVTPLGISTVNEQLQKGVYEKSGKAVIFDGEKLGLHTRVFINSEGLPTYEAKDVGLSLTKWNDYHFDESIIITANEQEQYMKVVIASIAQFAPEPAKRTKHLVHGVVKLQGGVKMSSRKGNIVTALDILQAARDAGAETGTNPDENTILAAVKYAFAKNRIGSDISYDPVESIALEGNSGPYLQYAHARARSILRKASEATPVADATSDSFEAGERTLLGKISEYHEAVDRAVADLMPHHICTYLYDLAQTFNRFYENNTVIGDPRQALRLKLVEQYADTLKNGLGLLGIVAPEKM